MSDRETAVANLQSPETEFPEDTRRLHELGYSQELKRRMRGFSNFAISFSCISILTGILQAFSLGMVAGGPRTMIIDWIAGGVLILTVGLSMAEICSAFPTAGGLYYWSARLAKRNKAAWSWFVGWTNMLGQIALTASIDFGTAVTIGFFIKTAIDSSFGSSPGQIFVIYGIILLVHGVLVSFGVRLVSILLDVSAWWHVLGTALMVVLLFALPTHHQSLGEVFTTYTNQTGLSWFAGSGLWVGLVGLVVVAYTIQGFDASAHTSEETVQADQAAPRGIISAIWVSIVVGLPLLLALCYALPGGVGSKSYGTIAGLGVAASAGVFLDSMNRHVAELLILVGIGGMLFCGMASLTSNSRMIYAFSRDGAVPGHRLWHRINPRTRTPTNSIWFAAVFAFVIGIPSLKSSVAFAAIVAVAVSSQTIAFVLPVFLRRRRGKDFQPGPFSLGRWSPLVNWTALIWTAVITVTLLLPQSTLHSGGKFKWSLFNFAPVACGVVMGYAAISWLVWARKWFTGPKVQDSATETMAAQGLLQPVANSPRELDNV